MKHKNAVYYVTNAHVVHNAVSVEIKYDGVLYPVDVVKVVYDCDLAVMTPQDTWLTTRARALDLSTRARFTESRREYGEQEWVVATDTILCDTTRNSYFDFYVRLATVNGQPVYNIRHLLHLCELAANRDKFLKFEFEDNCIIVVGISDLTAPGDITRYNAETCRQMGIAKFTNVEI